MEVREANAVYGLLSVDRSKASSQLYKQTELGPLPRSWRVLQIGDLRPFVTSGSRGWATFYSDIGAPFIRITNLSRDCIFPDLTDLRFVNLVGNGAEGTRTQLQDGDVLISITADIGIVGYVSAKVPKPAYINQHIALMRFDASLVSPKYVSYFLASENPQRLFRAMTDAGAKAGMNLTTVQQILLGVPPTTTEQEAIAEALSDADALIESLEQLIAKKRQIKQGTMHALLTGKQRLTGFSGEWEVRRLVDVLTFQVGFPFSSVFFNEEGRGLRLVKNRDLKSDDQIFHYSGKYDFSFQVSDGDVLIGMDGDFLPFQWCKGPALLNQRVGRIVPRNGLDRTFAFYYLIEPLKEIERATSSTTVKHLSHGDVEGIIKPLPSVAEQTAIATILSDMDTELTELETRLAKTRQLKQGMMQELLTGRIRLVQPALNVVPLPEKKETRAAAASPHNQQINEAVVVAALVKQFGSEDWPLARVRRTKLTYLLHRHAEGRADGFLKKAAGPYDPRTRYKGPEGIALKKGYVQALHNGTYEGFVASEHISEAETYFEKWYGAEVMDWLERFRLRKTDELELLTTVDMAMEDLRREGKPISVEAVRQLIHGHPEWKPKLERAIFSDDGIAAAIAECQALFAS